MVKDFPLLPLEKLSRKSGAERVSVSALNELKLTLIEMANKISIDAVAAAHHAKRVTIKREDISMAVR